MSAEMLSPPPAAPADKEHYQRLLQGMARVVGTKGYAAATIADIVGEAAVSRRTFYEHFQTKADCLIALYESVSLEGLSVLAGQLNPKLDWREQVEDALRAYFAWMAQNPVLMRTLFVDILAIGPDGLKVRRSVHEQIADFISQTVNAASRKPPQLSRELSVALVGGIHELILQQSEKGDLSGLADLAKVAADFVRRVFSDAGN
jgi:AcrR family transcriptional regulator